MARKLLDESRIHPAIRDAVDHYGAKTIGEVESAIAQHAIVIIGMAQNPFPKKARKALDAAGIAYHYVAYGSYFSQWRLRLALKIWSGWATFPMIFVKGTLIGGATDLQKLIDSGELAKMLA